MVPVNDDVVDDAVDRVYAWIDYSWLSLLGMQNNDETYEIAQRVLGDENTWSARSRHQIWKWVGAHVAGGRSLEEE